MKYVVKTRYREDVKADSTEPPPFSEWFDFKQDEYTLMLEVMWTYVQRRYADCTVRAQQRTLEISHLGVLHVINVPYFTAWMPDRSVIVLFKVEVKF